MAFKGKLIGALLGSFAGPMGTILGGVIGHLFDRATEERETMARLGNGRGGDPHVFHDSVSAAQLNFLSSLIGLSIAVANADRHVRLSQVDALKAFFRESFPYSEEDHRIIRRIIDETFLNRDRLDVDALAGYYRATSSEAGRLLLLRLLFKIAAADRRGVCPEEERMIRRIAQSLGIGAAGYQSIQAEFTSTEGRAYEILGVSPEASEGEIRSTYRRLATQYHPDTVANLGEEFIRVAEEKFKLVNEAYAEIRKRRGF